MTASRKKSKVFQLIKTIIKMLEIRTNAGSIEKQNKRKEKDAQNKTKKKKEKRFKSQLIKLPRTEHIKKQKENDQRNKTRKLPITERCELLNRKGPLSTQHNIRKQTLTSFTALCLTRNKEKNLKAFREKSQEPHEV